MYFVSKNDKDENELRENELGENEREKTPSFITSMEPPKIGNLHQRWILKKVAEPATFLVRSRETNR